MDPIIEFCNLKQKDCNILHSWLQEPHVREFWDDGIRNIEQTLSYYYQENGVNRFIFLIDGHPAGYIQSYDVKLNEEYKKFAKGNNNTIGVDFFIGNKHFLGKGLAKSIMKKFIETQARNSSRVIVDPDPINKKAIHVYETCGFVKLTECIIDKKPHQIMIYEKGTISIKIEGSNE